MGLGLTDVIFVFNIGSSGCYALHNLGGRLIIDP